MPAYARFQLACHSPSSSESAFGRAHAATDASCDGWNVFTANGVGGLVISTRRASAGLRST